MTKKKNKKPTYYAVAVGRKPGVYFSWADCKREITGYPGAKYKSFFNMDQACRFANNEEPMLEDGITESDVVLFVAAEQTGAYGICATYKGEYALKSGVCTHPMFTKYNHEICIQMFALMQAVDWGCGLCRAREKLKLYVYTKNVNVIWQIGERGLYGKFPDAAELMNNHINLCLGGGGSYPVSVPLDQDDKFESIEVSIRQWKAQNQNTFYMRRAKEAMKYQLNGAHMRANRTNRNSRVEVVI